MWEEKDKDAAVSSCFSKVKTSRRHSSSLSSSRQAEEEAGGSPRH